MALAQMQAAGTNRYVAFLIDQGRTPGEIERELRRRFPLESQQSIEAAHRHGQAAWGAASGLQIADPDYRLPASAVPQGQQGGRGYCYWVTATLNYPGVGAQQHLTLAVEATGSLTNVEVAQRAADMLASQQGVLSSRFGSYLGSQPFEVQGLEFHAVERCIA